MKNSLQLPSGYQELLQELKGRIRAAQVQAAFAVNRELILLYWSIGRDLSQRFAAEEWGGKIIDRLARDLQTEFPGVEGFSPRNLRYMRSLAEAWPDDEILQQLVAKLPWSHNVRVLDRIKDRPTREWYLRAALEYGWSRDVLVLQIKSRLHEREGKALASQNSFNDAVFGAFQDVLNTEGLPGAMLRKGKTDKWISFGVMLERAAPFAQQFPAMAAALRSTNDRRNSIPDSHPFEFKTGQKTKHLKVRERDGIKLDLTGVYREIMDFLDALP